MNPPSVELSLLILLVIVVSGPIVAERFRIPGLIGLIAGGMIVGPFVLEWVTFDSLLKELGDVGLLYLMFLAGIFGGGDGKFYAAVASFFPLAGMLPLFVAITLVGLVLAIFWFLIKRIWRGKFDKKGDFGKLPYGVAIGGGALAYAGFLFL